MRIALVSELRPKQTPEAPHSTESPLERRAHGC